MSINLHFHSGKKKLDVWQTPTYITEMCLMNKDGYMRFEVYGKAALRALHMYRTWVGTMPGSKEHIERVKEFSEEPNIRAYAL